MLGELDPKFAWYVARSGGLVAWLVCSASVIWGLLMSSRLVRRRGAPAWLLDVHRYLGTLAIVFTVIHLAGLWFDDYIEYGFRELLVPFTGEYRPVAVAWGIIAFYLLVAIQLTSHFMRRLPRRFWHAVHLGSFPLMVLATFHGFFAGTDRSNRVVIWVALAFGAVIVFLTGSRIAARRAVAAKPNNARAANIARAKAQAAARRNESPEPTLVIEALHEVGHE